MPRTAGAAAAQCLACDTLDTNRKHTCEAACGQCGIVPLKAWPGGAAPSKTTYLKAVKNAQKKQATARQKATAKPFEEGAKVKLPSRVKPSTEAEIDEFIYPELRSGPVLARADRLELARTVFRAYFKGGSKLIRDMGLQDMIAALKAAKVVVEPWTCDWFQGFVDSEADAKKRVAAGKAKGRAVQKEESEEKYDNDDFDDYSNSHGATYIQNMKKIAWGVADRDRKDRPSLDEIRADTYYWLDIENRIGIMCAGCRRKFGGRYRSLRWYIEVEHRKDGPNAGALSDAPCCCQCNTSSRARADAAAAALHAHDATYTLADSGTLAQGTLALMGRGSDDAAARRLARVRAATVTRSVDDAALTEAHVSTPARRRGDGVERFDPEAVPGSRDGVGGGTGMKSCPCCSVEIGSSCRVCPKCGGCALRKKRRS